MRRRVITLLVIVFIALLLALLFFFWQTGSGKVSHVYGLAYLISFDSPAGSSQSGTNIDPAIVVAVVLFLGLLTFAQISFYLFKRKRVV